MKNPFYSGIFYLILVLTLWGCGQEPIKVYRVPKEFLLTGEKTGITTMWQAPNGWREQTPTQMRAKSFSIPDEETRVVGDFGLIVLPLGGNRLVDNINLWRSELKLSSIKSGEETNYFKEIIVNGKKIHIIDFASEELLLEDRYKERILVAFFTHLDQQYFFKIRGSSGLVAREKPRLLQTIQQIKF